MQVVALDGVIRPYAWGSTSAIQNMLGLPAGGEPAAELWFGAHPDDPSHVPVHGCALDELIAADPGAALGPEVEERFGGQLPFLVKVLAAASPLSLQVHPGLDRARAGFAAEEAAGVPRDARERNYRDPNHKPELLCALTEFEALCGLRPVPQTLELLDEVALPELEPLRLALLGPDPLRTAFTGLLTGDASAAVAAVSVRATPDGPLRAAHLAAQHFPGDVGIVLALLLNHVRLRPGEAIYLGAGNVHSYLSGTGVEILANSDNVLRCGLTPKHVDVAEVLAVADFAELAAPRLRPGPDGEFRVPVPDFRLAEFELTGSRTLPAAGPRIVLCTAGSVSVADVRLTPGRAAFVPAAAGTVELGGTGHVFLAGVGE